MLRGFQSVVGGKIAIIDSENHSVEKKPNALFTNAAGEIIVDVANVEDKSVKTYIKLIRDAERAGYTCLGIDSLTHPWHELLTDVDTIARTKFGGNSFRAWSEGTPKQREFIDTIVFSKMHIVATGRVKTEWVTDVNDKGKLTPRKVGLATEQGKGLEYEFDIWMRLNEDHYGTILKDRFDMGLQDTVHHLPGEELAVNLANYLQIGDPTQMEIAKLFDTLRISPEQRQAAREKYATNALLLNRLRELQAEQVVA
jgi:hypothetical protein